LKLAITSAISSPSGHLTWVLNIVFTTQTNSQSTKWRVDLPMVNNSLLKQLLHVQACKANMWHKSLHVLHTCNACLFFHEMF
jgi:hypothetical protein